MGDQMMDLFSDFEFYVKTTYEIKEVNGVTLPLDYLAFMKEHNGGEGNVGKHSYMCIYRLEDIVGINEEYGIPEYLPGFFIWGTDMGDMLFGFSSKTGKYSAIDACSLFEKDIMYEEDTLLKFIERWDKELGG